MFTVILKDLAQQELDRVARLGNERFLVRKEPSFRLLSQITVSSYDVFGSEDAKNLLEELDRVRSLLEGDEDRKHIDEIRRLAFRCANMPGTVLVVTPFEPIVDN